MGNRRYLSMCTIYGDHHAELLPEWIEFHRLVGVERFFIYTNNLSGGPPTEMLDPYLRDGTVVLHDWPVPFPAAIGTSFNHCLREHGEESRWIAFLDLDEFLFSPTFRPVPELLSEYEQWPAVCAVTVVFGTSGHVQQPPGLVIENFLHRRDPEASSVKCIVDPARTERCKMAHDFVYREGTAVDENHEPLDHWVTSNASHEKLRVNHYWTMSEEAAERKIQQWSASATDRRPRRWFERQIALHNDVRDDTITPYVPALREALERRNHDG